MTAKDWVKRMARPATSRAYARIDQRIAEATEPLRRDEEELRAALGGAHVNLDRSISMILNAVSTQNAHARMQARELQALRETVAELTERVEALEKIVGDDARR
ncbi:MAG TPA: hypothetical protein VEI83_15020 [Acidimicrobiales bacterium]|nr:hypothetical protein [Acidimicrobiales bacterium]